MESTGNTQSLLHQRIITIGEALRQQYDEENEERLHKAVLCTEEVVRREETKRAEDTLAAAREEWKRERQQFFQDAHQSQMRAIAKQNAILEDKLRQEFSETLAQAKALHGEKLQKSIQLTWEEANKIKDEAVCEARNEERAIAKENAEEIARFASEDKQHALELAKKEKQQALVDEKRRLEQIHARTLQMMKAELEQQFEMKLAVVRSGHEMKLKELQRDLDELTASKAMLEGTLKATADLKEEWAMKYDLLKAEFMDFIDHVPGFRGEFILK